jgi:hypothetical protein
MAVQCIGIRMSAGGYHHEHITHIAWRNNTTGATGFSTRQEMVQFVESGNSAYVQDGRGNVAYLAVRVSSAGNKYVQTYADGIWSDNLLALPRV